MFSLLADGCWRLMDVYWAALCVHGGRSREWMLLDDCGTVKKETATSKLPQPRTYVRRLDETYFLIDPQKLIYRYSLQKPVEFTSVIIYITFGLGKHTNFAMSM